MEKMSKKVFCWDCKYYILMEAEWCGDECGKVVGHKDTALRVEEVVLDYQVKNKNNDCEYYENSIWYKIKEFLKYYAKVN